MSLYPSRRPDNALRQDPRTHDPAGDRAFVAGWLAHVGAGRIGEGSPMTDDARAAILENERLLRRSR